MKLETGTNYVVMYLKLHGINLLRKKGDQMRHLPHPFVIKTASHTIEIVFSHVVSSFANCLE